MEKIFVIGSNSFSGSAFIKHVLKEGYAVIGVSRSPEADPVFLPHQTLPAAKREHYEFHVCDLNQDQAKLMTLIHHHQPAYIVNFAAQSMVAESWQHPAHWMTTNVLSMVNLHEQLRACSFLQKYVHVSTPEVYGSMQGLVSTNTAYRPSTPYAVSRAACDMWLSILHKNYQFPVVFTRSANVYGAGQQLYRIIPKTILTIKLGKRLPLHGGGHSLRSFIHSQDVADGTLKVLQKAKSGDIYHFSTQRNLRIRDLVQLICKRLNAAFDEVVDITADRPGKDAAYLLNADTSYEQLGWSDVIELEEGIDETIEWVERHFHVLKQMPMEYVHKP